MLTFLFYFPIFTSFFLRASSTTKIVHEGTSKLSACRIIDLSEDLPLSENFNKNEGSDYLKHLTKSNYSQVLSYIVLQDGLKVAEYYNSENGIDKTTLHHAYSVTKSWVSLLIGILVVKGKLSLNDTLKDIWPEDLIDVWKNVPNASYRQNITVKNLLTMTSGCRDPPDVYVNYDKSLEAKTFGGGDLISVLKFPECSHASTKKDFSYMNDSILSYIIWQRSGLTPQAFTAKHVMPYLGIKDETWKWLTNCEGVAYSSVGISTTTENFAKFGQLYLQNGFVSGTEQVVHSSWIKQSTTSQVEILPGDPIRMYFNKYADGPAHFGYRFWIIDSDKKMPSCAIGACGHFICIWPNRGRVLAVNVIDSNDVSTWLSYEFVELVGDLNFDYVKDSKA